MSLDGLKKIVADTKGDRDRSEFHRGWAGCCDMVLSYIEQKIPAERKTYPVNETGLGISGLPNERMREFRIIEESGSVQIWVEVELPFKRSPIDPSEVRSMDFLQYLTPKQAMEFAKAFERCAVQALKHSNG